MKDTATLKCNLRGDAWALVWICAGMALFFPIASVFLPAKNGGDRLIVPTLSSLFTLSGLFALWWVKKTYVVASEDQLVISKPRETVVLRWDEISDYYFKKRDKYLLSHIEAKSRVFVLNHALLHSDTLRDLIQAKAHNARAKEWALFGTRTEDEWPRVFRYKDRNGCLLLLAAGGATLALLALQMSKAATYGGYGALWNHITSMLGSLSVPLRVAFVLIMLFLAGAMPFLIVVMHWPRIKAGRAYLGQSVSADLRGLVFQTSQEQRLIAWDQVLDFYEEPVPGSLQSADLCLVATPRGAYSFLDTIEDAFTLREIISKYATNAASSGWAPKPGNSRENLKSPNFSVPQGSRLYHFRTRSARALLLMFTLMCLAAPVPFVAGTRSSTADRITMCVLFIPLALATFGGWLGYFKAAIVTDENSFHLHGLLKTRSVRWDEIRRYRSDGYACTIDGDQQRLRYFALSSDAEELQEEIKRHATNSENREWKRPGSPAAASRSDAERRTSEAKRRL